MQAQFCIDPDAFYRLIANFARGESDEKSSFAVGL